MTRKRAQGSRMYRAPESGDLDDEIESPSFTPIRRSQRERAPRSNPPLSRKDAQLCKQVLLTVQVAVRAWRADPILDELEWIDAVPWPRLSRIRLKVVAPIGAEATAVAALQRATPYLRAAVADATSRKRTPALVFLVLPKEGGDHDA